MWKGICTLQALYLNNNSISTLRGAVFSTLGGETISLRTLYLNDNLIESVGSDTWTGLSVLVTLNLANNRLKQLTSVMFSGLQSLTHLDLNYNNISIVHKKTRDGLPGLEYLQLNCNQLETFVLESADHHKKEAKLNIMLGCNPLKCGSDICWMKESKSSSIQRNGSLLHKHFLTCNKREYSRALANLDHVCLNCSTSSGKKCFSEKNKSQSVFDPLEVKQ